MENTVQTVSKRRSQERTEVTKAKLLDAAAMEFSTRGFDAVTIREIEIKADVQRNLLRYHFGDKEGIWKAVVDREFELLWAATDTGQELAQEMLQDLPAHERVAYRIRSYVKFSAEHPEFNRLMVQEGKQNSWRVEYLVDTYLRPAMEQLRASVKEDINLSDEEFFHWYYMFVGGGALPFTMAPEAAYLFGVDVNDEEVINRHAEMMVDFLLTRTSD
ncbi:MAG: TetR/AcrR family transcriptional regulator [Pseudomonadota bacterium]